ncbi:MAG: hypothetical protein Tsb002_35400 [Wenzhouxiangellaceae bacterium]
MNDFERLQALLLEQERQRLTLLESSLDPHLRQQQLTRDLPSAFAAIGDDPALQHSLAKPVTHALHKSIENDRDSVASLLFPVMGPAIRRAVQEALRGAMQRINLALEHGLSPRAWRWRVEAWRSGEPFAQIVLRHSLNYSVDEVFLIHRQSGLMISRLWRREILALDQDAVASMLTAIQSFLRESLGGMADDPLTTVELGNASLWLVNGPDALLAAVIQGEPPLALREQLQQTLEDCHRLLGPRLTGFIGDPLNEPRLTPLLEPLLISNQPAPRPKTLLRLLWLTAALALLTAGGYWLWQQWQLHQVHRQLSDRIDQTPGLLRIHSEVDDGQVRGLLLRDPLAPELSRILAELNIPETEVALKIRPYLSQDEALLARRLGQAAGLEDAAAVSLDDGRILVNQPLDSDQWQRLQLGRQLLAPQWQLQTPPPDLEQLRQMLLAPPQAELQREAGQLIVSGSAPLEWINSLAQRAAALDPPYTIDDSKLQSLEAQRLQQLIASVDGYRLHFDSGVRLREDSLQQVDELQTQIREMTTLSQRLSQPLQIQLLGMSDGTDTAAQNQEQRLLRARAVAERLTAAGVPASAIQILAADRSAPEGFDPTLRYTELRVRFE